jgi:hypothetical protein
MYAKRQNGSPYEEDIAENRPKNKIGLPLLAIILESAPLLFVLFSPSGLKLSPVLVLLCIFFPIAGVMLGIGALGSGKGEIGVIGMVFAIVSVALPLLFAASVPLLFIGAITSGVQYM